MESRLIIFVRVLGLGAIAGLAAALLYFGFRHATPPVPVAQPLPLPTAPVTSSVVAQLPHVDPKPVVKVVTREPTPLAIPATPPPPPAPPVVKAPVVPRPALRPAPAVAPELPLPAIATRPPPRVVEPLPPAVADAVPEIAVSADELVAALAG